MKMDVVRGVPSALVGMQENRVSEVVVESLAIAYQWGTEGLQCCYAEANVRRKKKTTLFIYKDSFKYI